MCKDMIESINNQNFHKATKKIFILLLKTVFLSAKII